MSKESGASSLYYFESPKLSFSKHKMYYTVLGSVMIACIVCTFAVSQALRIGVDIMLATWIQNTGGGNGQGSHEPAAFDYWTKVYLITLACLIVLLMLRGVMLNGLSVRSGRNVHLSVLRSVLSAPIPTFFDVRTVGEILNRFSKDTETADTMVPEFMTQLLINGTQVASIFVMCTIASPYFAIVLIPLCVLFARLYKYFSAASRALKRLESMTRSPIYSSLSETLTGLETIRAYGATERVLHAHTERMERNQKFFYHMWMVTCWITGRNGLIWLILLIFLLLRDFSYPKIISDVKNTITNHSYIYTYIYTNIYNYHTITLYSTPRAHVVIHSRINLTPRCEPVSVSKPHKLR
jgi:ATP-binding cassette subfamily C (CFTR/MRP) protein 1